MRSLKTGSAALDSARAREAEHYVRRTLLEHTLWVAAFAIGVFVLSSLLHAQRGAGPAAQRSPREAAPIDLTGYWESFVTEDWRWRMMTPPKGSYHSVTLNAEARKVADAWDPAADEAAGNQCKSYGAAAVMRVPGRLHITWEDDDTLKIETEAGSQTRLLNFGVTAPPDGEPTWQGYAVATWQVPQILPVAGGRGRAPGTTLKAVTTRLRDGYLCKNGVPYSGNAVVTEYYNVLGEPKGDTWLVVTSIVDDPKFLTQPFLTSSHFKKLSDGSAWKPLGCTAE
ncbi:MAG: hypothetical protein HOP16_10495 [Acidobacteria bacterium]|nr:hypothetical protein [Acidobacteriota bacterium]